MNKIHPLATVSPDARLGDNIEIGPYAFIDANVEIGDGCKILPHAVIFSYVKMGRDCTVFPGAVVGAVPQDLKYEGEVTYVEIGDRVTIRECATINRGTKASGKFVTKVGDDTLVMSYVHIAHDCVIGNHCILVSQVALAGETEVEDWVILGGGTLAHQFSHIGTHAMVGAGFKIVKDVPPYILARARQFRGREPGWPVPPRFLRGEDQRDQGHLRDAVFQGNERLRRLRLHRGKLPRDRGTEHHPHLHPELQAGYHLPPEGSPQVACS